MFATQNHRPDFADTRSVAAESVLLFGSANGFDGIDAGEQLAQAEAADERLLRLVICVACATFTLALVASMA